MQQHHYNFERKYVGAKYFSLKTVASYMYLSTSGQVATIAEKPVYVEQEVECVVIEQSLWVFSSAQQLSFCSFPVFRKFDLLRHDSTLWTKHPVEPLGSCLTHAELDLSVPRP